MRPTKLVDIECGIVATKLIEDLIHVSRIPMLGGGIGVACVRRRRFERSIDQSVIRARSQG